MREFGASGTELGIDGPAVPDRRASGSRRIDRVSNWRDRRGDGPQLQECLHELIASGHTSLVVDLLAVTFLDSTALGVLVGALKRCRERGGELQLVMADPRILKIFEITGLSTVFQSSIRLPRSVRRER